MIYQQGRSFPPTAHGVGLIFILLSVLFFFIFPGHYELFLIAYPSFWIMFSTTTVNTDQIKEGLLFKRYGFFPFFFTRKIYLQNYDVGLIKVERVRYRTTQSTGVFVLSSQDTHDSFMALSLKLKGKYEYEVVFKGTRDEIMDFIRTNLSQTELRFFNGALQKDLEIKI